MKQLMSSPFVGYEELSRSRRVLSTPADNTVNIWGGQNFFLSPHLGEGCNFLGAFGRYASTSGFCVTEILSTACNTMVVLVILTELHNQS